MDDVIETNWRTAVRLTLPIFMGYFAAGVAYGMLATAAGMPVWFTVGMCFTVFSGTAQYAAIPFFVSGAGIFSVFLSTFLMSLRFIFYTLNMQKSLPTTPAQKRFSTAFLTDESFALLSTLSAEQQKALFFKITFLGVTYWTFATVVGIVLGDSFADFIPHLDFALPCLFAILAYEQYQSNKNWKPMLIAFVSFLVAQQISNDGVLLLAILISIGLVALLPAKFSEMGERNE